MKRLQSLTEAQHATGDSVDLDLSQTHTAVSIPVQHVVTAVDTQDTRLEKSENEKRTQILSHS